MGFMDKIRGLFKGREKQVKGGIDTVSDKVEEKVGPKHADQVDDASQKAKEAVDKLAGTDAPATPATPPPPAAATPATPPPAAEPPATPPAAPPT
jgi:MT0933-like antitoxin protein